MTYSIKLKDTPSQNNLILDYLKKGNTLTALDSLRLFGCFRLASRINDLRNEGHNIQKVMVKINGKLIARYSLGQPSFI